MPDGSYSTNAELFDLTGKTALVTGGTRGIGLMIARGLLQAGARVVISSRKPDACAEAEEHLSEFGDVRSIPADLSRHDECLRLAESLGVDRLHILVNNAGATWGAPLEEFPEAAWDKVIDLNLKSPFFLTQMLAPALRAAASPAHPAKVINIASTDGIKPSPDETYSYHASKSGLVFLTRRMAARLIRDNICVTAIAPGAFASEMNRAARDDGDALALKIPAGRIGVAEDMQGVAIFLASRAGDYAVGITVTVDGGVVYGRAAL